MDFPRFTYSTNRRFGLDLLRFIAIVQVVYMHGHQYISNYVSEQSYLGVLFFDGVTAFFVLSGFLIGDILIKLMLNNKLNNFSDLFPFWKRRWFRTLPLYFIFLFFVWITEEFIFHHSVIDYRYLFFVQNLFTPAPEFFKIAWSLCVEEWFYLLLPVIYVSIYIITKNIKKSILITIVSFIVIPYALRMLFYFYLPSHFSALDYRTTTMFRLDSLMYGVLGAYVKDFYPVWFSKFRFQCAVLGVVLMLGSYLIPGVYFINFVNLSGIGGIYFLLLMPFLFALKAPSNKMIKNAITHVSVISYSLYLSHIVIVREIVMKVVVKYFSFNPAAYYALYWIFSVIVAYSVYVLVEKPLTDLRDIKKAPLLSGAL